MRRLDEYVEDVMERLPPCAATRDDVARDLRAHLQESVAEHGDPEEAVRRMGPAADAARSYARAWRLVPAELRDRLGAFLLDVALGADLLLVALLLWGPGASTEATAFVAFAGASGLLSLLYFPVLEERFGQTLGKWIFGVCAVRTGGLRLGFGRALVRRLPLFFEFFWLDALVAPFTEKRQRAFDLVADTMVVEGRKPVGSFAPWAFALLALAPLLYFLWRGPLAEGFLSLL